MSYTYGYIVILIITKCLNATLNQCLFITLHGLFRMPGYVHLQTFNITLTSQCAIPRLISMAVCFVFVNAVNSLFYARTNNSAILSFPSNREKIE